MALTIYSNGIVEDFKAENNVFTDDELRSCFESYHTLHSIRLADVPNTWCLWGQMDNPPQIEFNKIGSEIVETNIFSHLILIHDSEINPEWGMTDEILFKSYNEYSVDLGQFINSIIEEIKMETSRATNIDDEDLIKLIPRGQTADKRVIFDYNPRKQTDGFMRNGFPLLIDRITEYLIEKFDVNITIQDEPLIILADTKSIFMVDHENTDLFFETALNEYTKIEDYEHAGVLSDIKNKWEVYVNGVSGFNEEGKEYRSDEITKSEKKIGPTKNKR